MPAIRSPKSVKTGHITITKKETSQLVTEDDKKFYLLPNVKLPSEEEGPTSYLGKGEFGTVSVALDENFEPFAAKLMELDKNNPNFQTALADIEKEAHIMKKLGRPCEVIEVVNQNQSNKTQLYIIQSLIIGKPLKNFWEDMAMKSQLPENQNDIAKLHILNEVIASFIAAFEATKELHDKGIIHGDLHTQNIMYDPTTKQATALDFGMSLTLEPKQEKVYLTTESPMSGFHRAPETVEPAIHREGKGPERVYDKSSDVYSLAIDCGIDSEFEDRFAVDFAGREIAQLMKLFKDLSQHPMLGGNGDPAKRQSLEEGINRLKAIQAQIAVRVKQKTVFELPNAAIQQAAKTFGERNSIAYQIREIGLPQNIRLAFRELSQELKAYNKKVQPERKVNAAVKISSMRTATQLPHFERMKKESGDFKPTDPSSPAGSPRSPEPKRPRKKT